MKKVLFILLCGCCIGLYSNAQITAAEYFFDTDPGVGRAIPISITSGNTVSFTKAFSVVNLAVGFHFLAIRTKDAVGAWGLAANRGFYISGQTSAAASITAAEYFFDTDPGVGKGKPISITPSSGELKDSLVLPLGSLPLGFHQLVIRVKDATGKWGLLENRRFNVCNTYGPLSKIGYQVEGNEVFFTKNSIYTDSVHWEFGDGGGSSLNNPIKTYTPGEYQVKLISVNGCGADTANLTVSIRGLQHINATVAGNNGISTIIYEGAGFTAATVLKVIRNGTVLLPLKKQFLSVNRFSATYNFKGLSTGLYDVVAVLGSPFDTLKNALTIAAGLPVNITADLSGPDKFRATNFNRNFLLKNIGNEDAVLVPVLASVPYYPNVAPGKYNLSFRARGSGKKIFIEETGIFRQTYQYLNTNKISVEVMEENVRDTIHKKHNIAYYQLKIPSHQSAQHIYVASNPGIQASNPMLARVYNPLLSSAAATGVIESTYKPCYSSFLKHEIEKQLQITLPETAWNTAFSKAYDSLMKTMLGIAQLPLDPESVISMPSVFSALLVEVARQPASGVPAALLPGQFRKIIAGVINNWAILDDITDISNDCIGPEYRLLAARPYSSDSLQNNFGQNIASRPAADCPPLVADDENPTADIRGFAMGGAGFEKPGCGVISLDPNTKSGPGNNDDQRFINHYNAVGFNIQFENIASAQAPAAYVEVNDTLDTNVFDVTSLELLGVGWGDSLVSIQPNKKNYSFLKDLRPSKPNYLRTDITTDTVSGHIQWRFYTVDTTAYQLTASANEGFLPPNRDGKTGAGYVSYSVKPKSSIALGTSLNNRASIVFDDNKAILTPVWQYKIDTLKPQSNVKPLAANVTTQTFTVNWEGSDALAGINYYNVYVSVNDSAYKLWERATRVTTGQYTGVFGYSYKFFSIAFDKAGNVESLSVDPIGNPDATTTPLATGQVVSIKNGLWSQPTTWSNNKVPVAATDVIIKHQVTVDINAVCKSVKAVLPRLLQVNSGRKLDIQGK